MKKEQNVKDVIEAEGGNALVSIRCGVHPNTVQSWIQRNSIPVKYWHYFLKRTRKAQDLYKICEL